MNDPIRKRNHSSAPNAHAASPVETYFSATNKSSIRRRHLLRVLVVEGEKVLLESRVAVFGKIPLQAPLQL